VEDFLFYYYSLKDKVSEFVSKKISKINDQITFLGSGLEDLFTDLRFD
jgi:hypothetical protein